MPCIVLGQPLLFGLLHAHTIMSLYLLGSIGGFVSCLFLVAACSDFYSLDLAVISCQLFLEFAGGQHVARAGRVCTHCGSVAVADGMHMVFECPALHALRQQYAPSFPQILTP